MTGIVLELKNPGEANALRTLLDVAVRAAGLKDGVAGAAAEFDRRLAAAVKEAAEAEQAAFAAPANGRAGTGA